MIYTGHVKKTDVFSNTRVKYRTWANLFPLTSFMNMCPERTLHHNINSGPEICTRCSISYINVAMYGYLNPSFYDKNKPFILF